MHYAIENIVLGRMKMGLTLINFFAHFAEFVMRVILLSISLS